MEGMLEPGLAHLVSRYQTGDAAAEHDYLDTGPGARRQLGPGGRRGCYGKKPERLHHGEGGAVSAGFTDTLEKVTPGGWH